MTMPRDPAFKTRPHYVYEIYGEDGNCLYVGCSLNVGNRIQAHVSQKEWWSEVARIEINKHGDFEAGRRAEAERTQLLKPTHDRSDHTDSSKAVRLYWRQRSEEQHAQGELCDSARCSDCIRQRHINNCENCARANRGP